MRTNTNEKSNVLEFPKATITKPDDCLMTIEKLIEEVNTAYWDDDYQVFAEIVQDAVQITGIYFKGLEIDSLGYLSLHDVDYAINPISVSINPNDIIKIVRNTVGYVFKDGEPKYLIDTKNGVIAIYVEN